MFFYWRLNIMGQWMPMSSAHDPSQKNGHGDWRPKISSVVELKLYETALSLDELADIYPRDEPPEDLFVVPDPMQPDSGGNQAELADTDEPPR